MTYISYSLFLPRGEIASVPLCSVDEDLGHHRHYATLSLVFDVELAGLFKDPTVDTSPTYL